MIDAGGSGLWVTGAVSCMLTYSPPPDCPPEVPLSVFFAIALASRELTGYSAHMSRKRKLPFAYCVASLALAAMLSSVRAQTVQYDADHPASLTVGVSSSVSEWRARGGGSPLEPTQGESNGWSRAVALALPSGRRSVDFGVAGVASPFHAAGATGTVTYAFAVVRCEAPADLSTLFDTSCSVRFEPVVWPGEPWAFSTSQLASTAAYAVNGASTNVFAGASGFQLVEVFWSVPTAMERCGASASCPAAFSRPS